MSNYTPTTAFGPKDSLSNGDPNKVIHGTQVDTEFNNIATAISTKLDSGPNIVIAAPPSGVPLTVNASAAANVAIHIAAATNTTAQMNISNSGGGTGSTATLDLSDGTSTASLQFSGSAYSGLLGTGNNLVLSTGTSSIPVILSPNFVQTFKVSSGAISGLGPVAATFVDMTPDKGTFTLTYGGFSGSVTATGTWARYGNIVCLRLGTASGTSNAITFTMTGTPASIIPAADVPFNIPISTLIDNGSIIATTSGLGVLAAGTGNIQLGKNPAGFTATGTKGLQTSIMFTYLLN